MSSRRYPTALYDCACARQGLGAFGSLGDAVQQGEGAAGIASAGLAKAASTIPAFRDAVMHLQSELNRFGPQAPVGLQYVQPLLEVNGLLDVNTASRAVQILQRRYQDSIAAFPGESQESLSKLQQVTGNTAMVNPIGFVMTGSATGGVPGNQQGVDTTTSLIQKYADTKGLPKAQPISILNQITSNTNLLLVAGLAAAAAYFVWRH